MTSISMNAGTVAGALSAVNIHEDAESALALAPVELQERTAHVMQLGTFAIESNGARADAIQEIGKKRREENQRWRTYCGDHESRGFKIDPREKEKHEAKLALFDKQQRDIEAQGQIPFSVNLHQVETFWRSARKPELLRSAIPAIDLKRPLEKQLVDATAEVGAAQAAVDKAEKLPRDLQTVTDGMMKQLREARENGEPKVDKLYRPGDRDQRGDFRIRRATGKIGWPTISVRADTDDLHTRVHFDVPDTVGLLMWLFGDEIESRLKTKIQEFAARHSGVSVEEKIRAVADAQENLIVALRKEDAVLVELEKQRKFLRTRPVPLMIALGIDAPAAKILQDVV